MKFLTDRQEIAKAININKFPVIRINIGEQMRGYDDCYEGDKIKVAYKDFDIRCTVEMFGDGVNADKHDTPWLYEHIELMPETVGLFAHFGYSDAMEMAEWNRVPTIQAGQNVVVIFYDDNRKVCIIRQMKVGKASAHVYPTAVLEDVE